MPDSRLDGSPGETSDEARLRVRALGDIHPDTAHARARGARAHLLRYTPALLLVLVAGIHHIRISVSDQSAWGAGAGFAMFSTLDFHGTRTLRITISTDSGMHRVTTDIDAAWLARVLPTQANLDSLAVRLLEGRWIPVHEPGRPAYKLAGDGDEGAIRARQVEVELWRRAFDASTSRVVAWRSGRAIAP